MTRIVALFFIVFSPMYSFGIEDEKAKVAVVVQSMFLALQNEDVAKLGSVTSPDFYAFDAGKRLTADELMAFVKDAHAAGKIYVWNITEPEVHIHGSTAWITYINRGSLETKSGKQDVTWLESAILRTQNGVWRIHFFHSTRVPADMEK